jgi:hypothetical protein
MQMKIHIINFENILWKKVNAVDYGRSLRIREKKVVLTK